MSDHVPRFSFLTPSVGDELLASATSCKLIIERPLDYLEAPDDESGDAVADESHADDLGASFELHGHLPADPKGAGRLLSAIIREFRRPRPAKGGGQ